MSAKNPINTSTFGFTDTRTQDTLQMDDTDAKVTVRKIIGHFEAAPMDAKRQENRVRDVRDAKNPSGTSTFCGHSPMSANVRDVRDLPDPDSGLEVKVTCPKCGAWKRIPPDAFLLADPRCPVCGEVMRPEPEGDPSGGAPTDPANPANPTQSDPDPPTVTDFETGEPLVVGTDAWLEATFGTACPDCGTTLTDGTCPTCGYPDDRPQWRIGRLVMAIAKALRSRHPQCRSAPCDACRQVVARMNRAVVANDWQGLIALWREVTTDGDAEISQ
jgi:rubrerythrin